jgi:hypothetical protein
MIKRSFHLPNFHEVATLTKWFHKNIKTISIWHASQFPNCLKLNFFIIELINNPLGSWSWQNKALETNVPTFIWMFFYENIDDHEYMTSFLSPYRVRKARFDASENILWNKLKFINFWTIKTRFEENWCAAAL